MAKKKNTSLYSNSGFLFILIAFIVVGVFGALFFFLTNGNKISCANSISCVKDLSGKYQPETEGVFMGKRVMPPQYLGSNLLPKNVLGDTSPSQKHIYVDLETQHLYANENGNTVLDFPISSGKWNRTPTGDFTIWIKLRYTKMEGGSKEKGTYYYLPNVPYVMFFYNDKYPKHVGYGLHGAYWHSNFGHPMSHGCINISPENAEKLYNWANPVSTGWGTKSTAENPGTQVTIYGKAVWE